MSLMMRVFSICRASSPAVACFRRFILSLEIGRGHCPGSLMKISLILLRA